MDDDRALDELAQGPLDAADAAILGQIRDGYQATDPVPGDLVERIRFSLALDEMFQEVAAMTRVRVDEMATRGDPVQGTRTETLTFSAERLTAMVTVSRVGLDRLRLDGWVAPAEACRVRLRMPKVGDHEVVADEQGRFSFDRLPEGFGQLSFHPLGRLAAEGAVPGPGDPGHAVVTPLFQL